MKLQPTTIARLVVLALLVFVLFQNNEPTAVKIFFWTLVNLPIFVLLLSTIILGSIMGWLGHMASKKGKKKQVAKAPPTPEKTDKVTPAEAETNPFKPIQLLHIRLTN